MLYVVASPDLMTAAATNLAEIGSAISTANGAAALPTVEVVAAAADEVSTQIAALFGAHARSYQTLSTQAAAFHSRFVQALTTAAASYASVEAANASPLQVALDVINAPAQTLLGRPLIGNGADGSTPGQAGGPGGLLYGMRNTSRRLNLWRRGRRLLRRRWSRWRRCHDRRGWNQGLRRRRRYRNRRRIRYQGIPRANRSEHRGKHRTRRFPPSRRHDGHVRHRRPQVASRVDRAARGRRNAMRRFIRSRLEIGHGERHLAVMVRAVDLHCRTDKSGHGRREADRVEAHDRVYVVGIVA